MNDRKYSIRILPLRQRVRDTYRILFFPLLLVVFGLVIWWLSQWFATSVARAMLIGGCVGMLSSLALGTPARMPIADGDRATVEAWLANHRHISNARGWVPNVPRALYFDSKIVRFDDNAVVGPVVMLRKWRRMLCAQTRLGA